MKNELRTFVIGDIHGDFTGLNVILKFLTSNNKTTKDDEEEFINRINAMLTDKE